MAASAEIRFLRSPRIGEVLVATAVERDRDELGGLCHVTVTVGDEVVVEFLGRSRKLTARCSNRPYSRVPQTHQDMNADGDDRDRGDDPLRVHAPTASRAIVEINSLIGGNIEGSERPTKGSS